MSQPRHPFERLFAQLTQGMSADGAKVINDLGPFAAAQYDAADRLEWIPDGVVTVNREFQLPHAITPHDQASDFLVRIYGGSYWRALDLHSLLVGMLDLLIGPPQGCAPSQDETRALLIGAVDLDALSYPYSGLVGRTLDVTTDGLKRALAFPGSALGSPQAIADAVTAAANAIRLNVHAFLKKDGAELRLALYSATDPLGAVGASIVLDPTPTSSACAPLGFTAGDGNLTAQGTPASTPYRPGYVVESARPGPRGGDVATTTWGLEVPVRLFRPIKSMQWLVGTIQTVPIAVTATDGQGPPETITNP